MNITQAKAALKKLYGSKAAWRYNEKAPKADEREALEARASELREVCATAKAARDKRYAELMADPEYRRLFAEHQEADKASNTASYKARAKRVTVGHISGAAGLQFFHIEAEGDNWQDAIDKARAKNGAA